jgi:hypothetical protein
MNELVSLVGFKIPYIHYNLRKLIKHNASNVYQFNSSKNRKLKYLLFGHLKVDQNDANSTQQKYGMKTPFGSD